MNLNPNKKRKRTKLECLRCGRTFDDDYKRKHELSQHGGEKIKVKHFGAPDQSLCFCFKKEMYCRNKHTTGNIK